MRRIVPTVAAACFTLLLLLTLTSSTALAHGHGHGHHCVHDEIKRLPGYGKTAPRLNVSYPVDTTRRDRRQGHYFTAQQASTYQPIRVQLFFDQGDCSAGTCGHCQSVGQTVPTYESASSATTCTSDDVLTTEKRNYIMNTLMPAAVAFYTRALNVVRVSGNLVVDGGTTCGSSPGTAIPSSHQSTGVADADFVVYVTAAPRTDRSSATVAWASACRFDTAGRPLVAHVNWIPAKLTNAATMNVVQQGEDEATAVHEIAHALGFSDPFFDDRGYLNAAGTGFEPGGTTTETSGALGKSVTYISSPRVVAEVRSHFGCTTAVGGEVEDQGGQGTAGSHWEKRVYATDSMSGISTGVLSFHSRFTLAFFEDTGHYTANYAAADTRLTWGKSRGCAFLQQKCNTQASGLQEPEFCFDTDSSNLYCTHDRLSRGYCGVGDYGTSLPTQFQYFSGQPSVGGSVQHSDFCPFVLPYSNTICIDATNSDSQDVYGNTYSAASRCFESDLLQVGRSAGSSRREARCFVPRCNGIQLLIDVKGMTASCPADGSAGQADTSQLSSSFSGTITCPASSVFGCSASGTTTPAPPGAGTPSTGGGGPNPTPAPPAGPGPTSAPPTTTAPATPVPGLVPTAAPPTLPMACADRVECGRAALALMPRCKAVAQGLEECFGTDCDAQLESFMRSFGIPSNCSDSAARRRFAAACVEGAGGVGDICYLAVGAAPGVPAVALPAVAVALLWLLV